MPYAPGISYHGDQYLNAGISGAADSINKGITDWRETRDKADFLNQKASDISQMTDPSGRPLMDAETLHKFYNGGISAKQAMVTDAVYKYEQGLRQQETGFGQDLQRQQLVAEYARMNNAQQMQQTGISAQAEEQARELAARQQQEDARKFTPDPATMQQMAALGYTYAPQSAQGGNWLRKDGTTDEDGTVQMDPNTGRPFGEWKGGRFIRYPVATTGGGASGTNPFAAPNDARTKRLGEIDTRLAELETEVATSPGLKDAKPYHLPWNDTRQQEYQKLMNERGTLQQAIEARPPAAPGGGLLDSMDRMDRGHRRRRGRWTRPRRRRSCNRPGATGTRPGRWHGLPVTLSNRAPLCLIFLTRWM